MLDIFEKSITMLLLVENATRQLNSNKSLFSQVIESLSNNSNNSKKQSELVTVLGQTNKSSLVALLSKMSELSTVVDITQLFNPSQPQQTQPQQQTQLTTTSTPTSTSNSTSNSPILPPRSNSTHRFVQPSALIPTAMLTSLFNLANNSSPFVTSTSSSSSSSESASSSSPALNSIHTASKAASSMTVPVSALMDAQAHNNFHHLQSPISSPNQLPSSATGGASPPSISLTADASVVDESEDIASNESPLSSSTDVVPTSPTTLARNTTLIINNNNTITNNNNVNANGKRKRRPRAPAPFLDSLFCHSCGETQTSQWRRGPDGCKSLCNACGIRFANIVNKEKALAEKEGNKTAVSINMLLNDSAAAAAAANGNGADVPQTQSKQSMVDAVPSAATIQMQLQQLQAMAQPKVPVPFYNSSKMSYTAPPPPRSKSGVVASIANLTSASADLSSAASAKRKLSPSATTLPIISSTSSTSTTPSNKSPKTSHPFDDITNSKIPFHNLAAAAASQWRRQPVPPPVQVHIVPPGRTVGHRHQRGHADIQRQQQWTSPPPWSCRDHVAGQLSDWLCEGTIPLPTITTLLLHLLPVFGRWSDALLGVFKTLPCLHFFPSLILPSLFVSFHYPLTIIHYP
ncbi:hypothetical protein SAMD00019534_049090 [Acytostelium subglobosum LB1]|uniref:hypothetical protein n=1 Tax=Acytostelium subglobosum LB1 TaxID=1410327 RepID=UPI000644918A|nr:hypothetical protein SAMD00019534_049090 [Acytostelium subglobosum LB1]GAM21734.1 hypothetical protein SAMD00019534_049090 [Acytostelium subglobosum LB1]|eukprot:XP_012754834.1 hypothetical protein SAMD00019534_049090 [Acytostelium subglobosum LB1]